MNITDQETQWFEEEGTLTAMVDYAILNPLHKVGASIQYPTRDFLMKNGFKFEEELPPRTAKSQSTFPWYIDLAMKTVYFRTIVIFNLHEKSTVECLPSKLISFCSTPKVKAQLQARNLGIL